MPTFLHVITKQEFNDKYKKMFSALDESRITDKELPNPSLEDLISYYGNPFTFGSDSPSKHIFPNAAMAKVQGEFLYADDGVWYILDGDPQTQKEPRKSIHGTGILVPNTEKSIETKKVYDVITLGRIRKSTGEIKTYYPLNTDGIILILPLVVYPESVGLNYLVELKIT